MLNSQRQQRAAGQLELACAPFAHSWGAMLGGGSAAAGGGGAAEEEAARFPVTILCLDREHRKTVLEAHAALVCVVDDGGDEWDSALLRRLVQVSGNLN